MWSGEGVEFAELFTRHLAPHATGLYKIELTE